VTHLRQMILDELVWRDRGPYGVRYEKSQLDHMPPSSFVSFREQIYTGGPLGRAIVIIIGAIAELERNLIIERVRAGMRRARLEGQHIGRNPLQLDNVSIQIELLNPICIQLAPFVADDSYFHSQLELELRNQLDHLRERFRLREHEALKLITGERPLSVEDHEAQIFL